MEIVIIVIVAFVTAILTFFSGFGLGTILTPVFMLFFPVEVSIALTGIVHFFNNIFKLFLVGKKTDREVALRFGIPAVLAAVVGAWLLLNITALSPIFSYEINGRIFEVSPVKFIIALLLIVFVAIDFIPYFSKLQFSKNKLSLGGALSGFFGGLLGNQGALRSAFFMKAGLSKESFIATAVVISTFVDITRLAVYATRFTESGLIDNLALVISATLSGIIGSCIGNKLLKKVTLKSIQKIVATMLIIIALAFGVGLTDQMTQEQREQRQSICEQFDAGIRSGGCREDAPSYCRIICYRARYINGLYSEDGCGCGY